MVLQQRVFGFVFRGMGDGSVCQTTSVIPIGTLGPHSGDQEGVSKFSLKDPRNVKILKKREDDERIDF